MTHRFRRLGLAYRGRSHTPQFLRNLLRRSRPSFAALNPLNSGLAGSEADVCCCGIRCRPLAHLVFPHLWAAVDNTTARSWRPHTQAPLRPVFPPRTHSDYLWHSTVVPVPAAIPLSIRVTSVTAGSRRGYRRRRLRPGRLAGFLRVLLTHCLFA